jgi:sulfate/thiosulfate transport system ATP-binding protein
VPADSPPRTAAAYTRPHEFDVSRTETGSGLWAVLENVTASGAMVRLELAGAHGGVIHAELGRDQFDRLNVHPGDRLYVTPRKVRVFVE